MRRVILAGIFFLWGSGCVTSWDDSVAIHHRPEDDKEYFEAYLKATRDDKVFVNFETRYTMSITYLSPDFRQAFAKRFESLFGSPQPFLDDASSKLGFFISVFSPDDDKHDLKDEQLWHTKMMIGETVYRPTLIKRLSKKERWRPFFSNVHNWSYEYLVLFDTPTIALSANTLKERSITLSLSNSDARIAQTW